MVESEEMGRVVVEAKVENLGDLWMAEKGKLDGAPVRSVVIPDALVDTGASVLSLPPSLIAALGLEKVGSRPVRTAAGPKIGNYYSPVRLTVQGRFCTVDVMDVPEGIPTLIGQIPLEILDFLVDLKTHKLIGNPAHDGQQMFEQY